MYMKAKHINFEELQETISNCYICSPGKLLVLLWKRNVFGFSSAVVAEVRERGCAS